ncbi:MAG: hypothetical protein HN712_22595 [Gemmatimonadetes bacterium]|jgi:hypothetical protein|nr:hypothetical protein [Gemmatimonadota bacterium]
MVVRWILLLSLAACGNEVVNPDSQGPARIEPPLVRLPTAFRGDTLYSVMAEGIGSGRERRFPDLHASQTFEYARRRYYGVIMDFGDRLATFLAMSDVFPGQSTRFSNPYLEGLDVARFVYPSYPAPTPVSNGSPEIYFSLGRYLVYVSAWPTPGDADISIYRAAQLADEILSLNPDLQVPKPFYVALRSLSDQPEQPITVVPDSQVILRGQIETVLSSSPGHLTLTLALGKPFMKKKTYPVAHGMDTISFADTLTLGTIDLPASGSSLTVLATLAPPFDAVRAYSGNDLMRRQLPNGLWSHTAQLKIVYEVE